MEEKFEIDRKIIDLIQKYPFIYDKKETGYKDPKKKNNAYQEIAEELKAESGEYVQKRFKTLREQYVRSLAAPPSGSGAQRYNPIFSNMTFLDDSIRRRKRQSNITAAADDSLSRLSPIDSMDSNLLEHWAIVSEMSPLPEPTPGPSNMREETPRPPKKKKVSESSSPSFEDFTDSVQKTLLAINKGTENLPKSANEKFADFCSQRVLDILEKCNRKELPSIRRAILLSLDDIENNILGEE